MINRCDAIVVTCIDFRFQQSIDQWLKTHLGYGNYDRVGIAGGVKNWAVALSQIEIAIQLHGVHRIILINHEDCGAYGDEGTFERHTADLQQARTHAATLYPAAHIETYFARLDGSLERIE